MRTKNKTNLDLVPDELRILYTPGEIKQYPKVAVTGKYRARIRQRTVTTELRRHMNEYKTAYPTVTAFAHKLGCSESHAGRLLHHPVIPEYSMLKQYADRLGTTPEKLIGHIEIGYTETVIDLWMFKGERPHPSDETVELLDLIEEYKPINWATVPDEAVVALVVGIAEQARKDLDNAKKGKQYAKECSYEWTAQTYLDNLHEWLTGDYDKARQTQSN